MWHWKVTLGSLHWDHSTLGSWDDFESKNNYNYNSKPQGVKIHMLKLHNAPWMHVLLSRGCRHLGLSLQSNLVGWSLHLNPRCLFAVAVELRSGKKLWTGGQVSISRSFSNTVMRGNVVNSEDNEKTLETIVFQIWDKIKGKVPLGVVPF